MGESLKRNTGTDSPEETGSGTEIDFPAAALYLAKTYKNLVAEAGNIRDMLEGCTTFTEDMAITELMAMTASSDQERVQTSSLQDQTARIAEKLADGYVEKRRRQLQREAEVLAAGLAYVDWKIGIVETAMENRMTKNEATFFRLVFLRNKTYREIRAAYKRGKIYDHDIKKRKDKVLQAVADQIQFLSCMESQQPFVRRLSEEALEDLNQLNHRARTRSQDYTQ